MNDERSFSEIVAERGKPGELERIAWRIERTGGCTRPIRLKGRSTDRRRLRHPGRA
jgi:hypothetical protein